MAETNVIAVPRSSLLERAGSQSLRLSLILFGLFFVFGILVSYRSLGYPWYWDDLHLVRTFSGGELKQVFTGTWDVDHIETPGYRPLFVVFNHVRAAVLGETVVAHRLLDIALVAAFLTVWAAIALELGMSRWAVGLAGLLAVATKADWTNLVWILEGTRALTGLLLALVCYLAVVAVKQYTLWKVAVIVFLAALALLTREEAIAMFPMVPLLALVYMAVRDGRDLPAPGDYRPRELVRRLGELWLWTRVQPWFGSLRVVVFASLLVVVFGAAWLILQPRAQPRFVRLRPVEATLLFLALLWLVFSVRAIRSDPRLANLRVVVYTSLSLLALGMAFFLWRSFVVGGDPVSSLSGWRALLIWALSPMGQTADPAQLLWLVTLGSLIGFNVFVLSGPSRLITLYWLVGIVVVTAPGVLYARPTGLFQAIPFLSFGVAHMLSQLPRVSRVATGLVALVVVLTLGYSVRQSMIAQESVNPLSLEYLENSSAYLWGWAEHTIMPAGRREELQREFAALGINSGADYERRYPELVQEAEARGLAAPNPEGRPFKPRILFLQE